MNPSHNTVKKTRCIFDLTCCIYLQMENFKAVELTLFIHNYVQLKFVSILLSGYTSN